VETNEAASPLPYQSKPLLHRRRAFKRGLIAATLALGLLLSLKLWPRTHDQIRLFKLEWRLYQDQKLCLAHPIPPGIPVYQTGTPGLSTASPELNGFCKDYGFGWLGSLINGIPPRVQTPATVYMGQRRATNGLSRFIAVDAVKSLFGISFCVVNRPMSLSDPRLDGGAPHIPNPMDDNLGQLAPSPMIAPPIVVYSAIEDPADVSHFSFSYDYDCYHVSVDCRLQPDGSVCTQRQVYEWTITPEGKRVTPLTHLLPRPGRP
jgi:hypothetical protein